MLVLPVARCGLTCGLRAGGSGGLDKLLVLGSGAG